MNTIETEQKVLDVNVDDLVKQLDAIGAKKVYDGIRVITHFDTLDNSLRAKGESIKLTEETKLKLEHMQKAPNGQADAVKVFVSRKEETVEFLKRTGLAPVAEARARRISYELDSVDFDIDCFPGIPPFMEIDADGSSVKTAELLDRLNLSNHEVVVASTPEIFARYGKDYYDEFAMRTSED